MKLPFYFIFGSVFLFFMVWGLLGCNAVAYETKTAWKCYREVVDHMENSHFDPAVTELCMKEAAQKGYRVSVEEDGIYEDMVRYHVVLDYDIKIPIFQLKKQQQISGYAI